MEGKGFVAIQSNFPSDSFPAPSCRTMRERSQNLPGGAYKTRTALFADVPCPVAVWRIAWHYAAMVRVPKIESIRQEQKRFLKDFDRQVAEIDRKRAKEQIETKPAKDDDPTA